MKRYGLRIGETGVEFSTREEREKALLMFTHGGTVKINQSSGIIYSDEGSLQFGTYERESNEVLVRCGNCNGTFGIDVCGKREYPDYQSWRSTDKWHEEENFICDGCFAKKRQEKEIAEAKERLANANQV